MKNLKTLTAETIESRIMFKAVWSLISNRQCFYIKKVRKQLMFFKEKSAVSFLEAVNIFFR